MEPSFFQGRERGQRNSAHSSLQRMTARKHRCARPAAGTAPLCRGAALKDGCVLGEAWRFKGHRNSSSPNGKQSLLLQSPRKPMHGRTFQPMEAPLQPHLPCESHLHSVPSLMGVSAEKRPFFPTVGKSQKIPSAFVALLKMKSAKGGYPLQASTHRHTRVFSFSTAASDPKVNGKGV